MSVAASILRALRPGDLAGPILDKELRVSSRRRRMYVLRTAYLLLLLLVVAVAWIDIERSVTNRADNIWRIQQMSRAGTTIVMCVVWFQFLAVQLVALVLMSTAISDEILHSTLGTLMTTPITGLQVVMGKLLGRLWHMVVLLAISLPVLALVRVFGGVSWDFVVAGVCITLSAALLLGSLSLYFSIFNRRAYLAILKALILAAAAFLLAPALIWVGLEEWYHWREIRIVELLSYANPYLLLAMLSEELERPGRTGASTQWPITCGVLLGATAIVLAISVRIVRKVALRQATGEAGLFVRRRKMKAAVVVPSAATQHTAGIDVAANGAATAPATAPAPSVKGRRAAKGVRPITGSPIVWREIRQSMLRNAGLFSTVAGVLIALGVIVLCVYLTLENGMNHGEMHCAFVAILGGLGLLVTAVLSATGITIEKEARSWALLLATPMADRKILWGKTVGVWRRCLPAWVPMGLYVAVYTAFGLIHPIVPLCLAITVAGMIGLLTGSGLYLGVRCRRTTAAVMANVGFMLGLWALLPALAALASDGFDHSPSASALFAWTNPGVQAMIVTERASGQWREHRQDWERNSRSPQFTWPGRLWRETDPRIAYRTSDQRMSSGQSAAMIGVCTLGYCAMGAFFAWRARQRLRKNIF